MIPEINLDAIAEFNKRLAADCVSFLETHPNLEFDHIEFSYEYGDMAKNMITVKTIFKPKKKQNEPINLKFGPSL